MAEPGSSPIRDEIAKLLEPLMSAAEITGGPVLLLQALGHIGDLGNDQKLQQEFKRLATLVEEIISLNADSVTSFNGITHILTLTGQLMTEARSIETVITDPHLAQRARNLGLELTEQLFSIYLRTYHPRLFRTAVILALITPAEESDPEPMLIENGTVNRVPWMHDKFHFDRLTTLLEDPFGLLKEQYFPNGMAKVEDAFLASVRLFPLIRDFVKSLDLGLIQDFAGLLPEDEIPEPDPNVDDEGGGEPWPPIDDSATEPDLEPIDVSEFQHEYRPCLTIYLLSKDEEDINSDSKLGLMIIASSAEHPDAVQGYILGVEGETKWSEVRDNWRLEMQADGSIPAFIISPKGVKLATPETVTGGIAKFLVERIPEPGETAFVLGSVSGTHLELGGLRLHADLEFSLARQAVSIAVEGKSGAFILSPNETDGFLSAILPREGKRVDFDFGLILSSDRGFQFKGGAGLDATFPIGLSVAGLTLSTIHLRLQATEAGVSGEVSAGLVASIGPVNAVIDGIGLASYLTFPETGGNIGVANLDVGLKLPNAIGLSIDASVVVGGGFVSIGPQDGEYSGTLELVIEETLTLKAIGLLTTKMPDGSKGYSLLIIITAEDFEPIPLPLGFKLTGVGGLIAVNRTFDEDVLRAGLKNHVLDGVLFPKDPIHNAPQILSSLDKVFPPANGHYLFGPVVQIGWGTPTLINANVALVLELGARLRVLILAQVSAVLPDPETEQIRLQMDAIGVIDFDQGTASLDATLHDSRLLKKFVLTGDMAMRLKWESPRNFALAIGGLNKAFNPPPNFPKLERIAINLSSGDNPRIRCEAYFALTSNTVQFGARAELYAETGGFSIQGEIGFDVLIQFDPFQFLAEFFAQVQLKHGSTNLFTVRVDGALVGPRPLRISGKATFEILWCDFSVHFDVVIVEGEKPPLPDPVDVMPLLIEALGNPASWTGQLPEGERSMVTLRPKAGTPTSALLHPLGTLTIKQNIVPLDMDISRFGSTVPAGARNFTFGVNMGVDHLETNPVTDFFAPAQFFEMSDDEKLSRPSFEEMPAGIRIGSNEFTLSTNSDDWLEVPAIEFETIIVDKDKNESRPNDPDPSKNLYKLNPTLLNQQARFGAAGTSDIRRTGKAKYRKTTVGKYHVEKENWNIVATDNLTVQPVPGTEGSKPMSYSEAEQALDRLKQETPTKVANLKILRFRSEVQAVE